MKKNKIAKTIALGETDFECFLFSTAETEKQLEDEYDYFLALYLYHLESKYGFDLADQI